MDNTMHRSPHAGIRGLRPLLPASLILLPICSQTRTATRFRCISFRKIEFQTIRSMLQSRDSSEERTKEPKQPND